MNADDSLPFIFSIGNEFTKYFLWCPKEVFLLRGDDFC